MILDGAGLMAEFIEIAGDKISAERSCYRSEIRRGSRLSGGRALLGLSRNKLEGEKAGYKRGGENCSSGFHNPSFGKIIPLGYPIPRFFSNCAD